MKNIKDSVIEFLKNENIKKELSEVFRPLGTLVYNEIYIYLWSICIFNVFLIFIILANLILLLKLFRLTEIISMGKN
jgi:hypothetical protein